MVHVPSSLVQSVAVKVITYSPAVGIEDSCGVNVAMPSEVCTDDVASVIATSDGPEILAEIV